MKCCKLQNKLCQGLNLSLQIYLCIIVIKFTLHIDTAFFPKDMLLFTGQTVQLRDVTGEIFALSVSLCSYWLLICNYGVWDRLCGLVVGVPGCVSWGPAFDFLSYQIFWEVMGLEQGPLSLVSTIEELLTEKVAAPV
jgi:hypothetical protein